MPFSSKKALKIALRCAILLILAIITVSLFYSKEISQIYREWKTGGSSQESIALTRPTPGNASGNTAGGTAARSGSADTNTFSSAIPGYGLPDPGNMFEQSQSDVAATTAPADDGNFSNSEPAEATENAENPPAGLTDNATGHSNIPPSAHEPVGGVEITTASGQQVQVGGVAPLQRQDSIITRGFIYELAGFLVNSYYPAGTHQNAGQSGYISTSLLNLNVHYGADTPRYFGRERAVVLRYILSPSMLEALYRLYEDDFLTAMQQISATEERRFSGGTRRMTQAEQKRMFADYAVYSEGLAALFEACAASPAIREKLDAYYAAAVENVARNQAYIEASIAYDQAAPENESRAKAALNQAQTAYDNSFKLREEARDSLLLSLKRYPGVRTLSDSNILYGAGWIKRRLADDSANADTLSSVSRILNSLAAEMKKLGEAA